MTKFEEEHIKFNNEYGNCKSAYYQKAVRHHFKNWHSDEEFQDMKESYWNQAESILSMLEEIKSLKSQLQQQALPVVPECVAEFVSGDETELSKADRIAYLLKSVEGDNYYLEEYLTNAGIISQEQGEHLYAWATNQTHETILKLWNGYQVEKPQLFYLKNKITGNVLVYDESPELSEVSELFATGGEFELENYTFTQSEINSMQTGSYELVPVEDGE